MSVKIFKTPQKIKIRDIGNTNNSYYIRRFEYGDYDNWVEGVIFSADISTKYIKYYDKKQPPFEAGDYSVCIKEEFANLSDVQKNGVYGCKRWEAYSTETIKVKTINEILDLEIEVVGEYTID